MKKYKMERQINEKAKIMGKLKSLISARTLIARSALLCEMENVSLTSAGELTAIQLKHASHIFTRVPFNLRMIFPREGVSKKPFLNLTH